MDCMTNIAHGHGTELTSAATESERIGTVPDVPPLPTLPKLCKANTTPESIISEGEGFLGTSTHLLE